MNSIVLIGFMGSGKSSVGRELAKRTGHVLLDADSEIEKAQGKSISEIFQTQGEAAFRQLEREYLEQLAVDQRRIILSAGGGMPLAPGNPERMQRVGTVVYLKASVDTLYERLKYDTQRPLLQQGDKREIICNLLQKREPSYASAAQICLVTDGKSLFQVVEELLKHPLL